MKKIKEELSKWRDILRSWIGRLIIVKVSVLPNLIYRFNSPNQNPSKLFHWYQHTNSKVYMESQKTETSQHDIEGEEQSWRTDVTWLQDLL